MTACDMKVPLLVFLAAALLPIEVAAASVPSPRVGIALFEDGGAVPTFLVRPLSLQKALVRLLRADHDLATIPLRSATSVLKRFPDPNTQMIPPALRSGDWRNGESREEKTDWADLGRRERLNVVVVGTYEQFGAELRYFAEGLEPISSRILFGCKIEGVTSEKLMLESLLAECIAERLAAQEPAETETPPGNRIVEKEVLPPGKTSLTAEEHYENGYALAQRYKETEDEKLLEGAAEEYRAALAKDSKHFRALNNLGTVLHRLGRYEEALAYYDRVLEVNPKYVRAMENAALAHRSLGQMDEAVKMWKRALVYEDRESIRKIIEETLARLEKKE
jgi:tetratricopeptide repeat protein